MEARQRSDDTNKIAQTQAYLRTFAALRRNLLDADSFGIYSPDIAVCTRYFTAAFGAHQLCAGPRGKLDEAFKNWDECNACLPDVA